MLPPFISIQDLETATAMLRKGATRGMVNAHLKRQGLSEHIRQEVLAHASRKINQRARAISSLVAVAGFLMVIGCLFGIYLSAQQDWRLVKLPTFGVMVGLMVLFGGIYYAFQKRI